MSPGEAVKFLEGELRALDTQRVALAETETRLRGQIDDINIDERPEFPTHAQIYGIHAAAQAIKDQIKPSSHHGDPVGPESDQYVVCVDGERGFISVRHGSPYSRRRTGGKLWDFTDTEVAVLHERIRAEGLVVVSDWRHDSGISVIAAVKR